MILGSLTGVFCMLVASMSYSQNPKGRIFLDNGESRFHSRPSLRSVTPEPVLSHKAPVAGGS